MREAQQDAFPDVAALIRATLEGTYYAQAGARTAAARDQSSPVVAEQASHRIRMPIRTILNSLQFGHASPS
jgi:hypothetical protein